MRDILIERTIHVIAAEGLDKTTTKAIVNGTGINEAYIYRHFSGKEDLLAKSFDYLDEELVTKAMHHIMVMYEVELDFEIRCRLYFSALWRFVLGNREKCLAFIRYYYSPYFQKYSSELHQTRYIPLIKIFSDAFREKANIWMLLNHMLCTVLDFAVKVFDGAVPDNDDTAEHVFLLIYHSVGPYFKKAEEC